MRVMSLYVCYRKRLTGNSWLPAMVGDDGSVAQGSERIAGWRPGPPRRRRRPGC